MCTFGPMLVIHSFCPRKSVQLDFGGNSGTVLLTCLRVAACAPGKTTRKITCSERVCPHWPRHPLPAAPLPCSAEFEAASESITRELRDSLTGAKTQTLEEQSQNNQLRAQLALMEGRCAKLTAEVEAANEALDAAEMVGKRMEWELAETEKANAAQIAEMQWEVDHKKAGMVATIERFERKIALLSEVPPTFALQTHPHIPPGATCGCMAIDTILA